MPADRDMNIFDTASVWAERLMADGALDAAAEAELEAWLQADPQHQAALNACLELEGMIAEALRAGGAGQGQRQARRGRARRR